MNYFETLVQTVAVALQEDIGSGDLTASMVDQEKTMSANVITRETAVICGQPWANEVFRQVDKRIQADWLVEEGQEVSGNTRLLNLSGPARGLLTAERSALNFLQLLSGTATATKQAVEVIADSNATLLDTRKTIPGLRLAQKYAVKLGGGENHRIGLFDAFLIKENHIEAAGSISHAIAQARQINSDVRVEVEVESLDQLTEAMAARPDWVMLDNFSTSDMKKAVEMCAGSPIKLEASGGIESQEDLKMIAATGVHYISIGALTKHIRAIDLSMRIE